MVCTLEMSAAGSPCLSCRASVELDHLEVLAGTYTSARTIPVAPTFVAAILAIALIFAVTLLFVFAVISILVLVRVRAIIVILDVYFVSVQPHDLLQRK